jgi:ABC-type antimicrobial peptide transport system permease subunit
MFRYNFKIAFRNLARHKGFSAINILGLTLGMTCSFIMLLMVYDVFNADTFHKNYDNLFIFQQDVELESGTYQTDRCGGAIGPFLKDNYPQIEEYVRLGFTSNLLIAYFKDSTADVRPISMVEKQGIAVDSTFSKLFSFQMVNGNPGYAYQGNHFIVLTETLSEKLFNKENPIGKRIILNEEFNLEVTGIIKDVPKNSSLEFSYIVPFDIMSTMGYSLDGFEGTNFFTYFLLRDKNSKDQINLSLNELLEAQEYDEQLKLNRYLSHIKEAFLYGESMNYLGLYILFSIGIGILLIACINYINLSTAKSFERAKEIGIRKTGGASRKQLIIQFLVESFLIALVAIHLSILMVELILPVINRTFDADIRLNMTDPIVWIILLIILFFTGILSGLYPAFILSNIRPAKVIKEMHLSGNKGSRSRKILVVVQFALTLFFIVSTLVLYKQFMYLQKADFGISRENIIHVPTRGMIWEKYQEIKNDLLKESSVLQVSSGSDIPTNVQMGDINWGKTGEEHNIIARIMWVGEDMDKMLDLNLVHGKFYSKDTPAENDDGIIVNEEIIRILGYEDDPIGKDFRLWDMDKKIMGVVKDYKFIPFDIGGSALILPYGEVHKYVFIKVVPGFQADQLVRLKDIFEKHNPDYPFTYSFLEDYEYPFFKSVKPLLQVLFYLCGFGIFISCLGLFGLAMYTTLRKTKEIGIRKAFGASVSTIIILLTKQYIRLVLLACIISLPIAVLLMKGVLNFFTVKTSINTLFMVLIVIFIIAISVLTILYHSVIAARKNPINSLRYE